MEDAYDDIRVARLELGASEAMRDGLVHRKIIPSTIVVQPRRGHYVVTGPDGAVRIDAGEIALVAAHTPVAFAHHGDRSGTMGARWVHVQATLHGVIDPCALRRTPCRIGGASAERAGAILARLHETTGDDLAARLVRLGLATQLLGEALAAAPEHPRARERLAAAARLGPISTWMEAQLHRPLTIDDVALAASLSRSRLHAVFQRHLGRSPMAHLKELRLQAAARRLLTSPDPIGEVADATGFANPFHFSREFSRRYGMPPRRYRDEQRLWDG